MAGDYDHDEVQRLRVRLQVVEGENRRLLEMESTYRFVAENTTDAIIMINPESKMLFVNHAAEEVFGYAHDEMIGQSVTMLMPESYRPRHLAGIARYLATGIKHLHWDYIEFPGLHKDGHEVPLALAYRESIRDGQHLFLGAVRDITARKEAEDALKREHAFLLAAIEILPFPFFVISPAAKIIRANRASYDFLQQPDIDRWWDVDLLTPDTRIPIPPDARPGMLALHGSMQRSTEWIMVFPDGRQVSVLIHAAPVCVGEELVAAVVAVQDITALKEADRAKDEFLAFTSHELLTPVAGILGWLRVAKEDQEIIPQALESIERSAARQERLVRELLDTSRIIHRKLSLRREPADLWVLAEQSVDEARQSAQARQLMLTMRPPAAPLPVLADPGRIRQAIGNLLANAIKFTDPGGEITVTGSRTEQQATIAVHDTGRGIAPEQLTTIFAPFKQLGEGGAGLGLGLALVKGIAELHGGHVSASSPGPGKGSTFRIILPLA